MLRVFNRPVEREPHRAFQWQTPGERTGMRTRQPLSLQARVVEQARESFAGGLEVVKESCERRLAATPNAQEREHEITDGFPLVPVCVGQNEADILAEASGQRVLSHRK